MAPPKPPNPATSTTHKRHHRQRHIQQQQSPPEEPPSPARNGRASGSALPPAKTTSAASISGSKPNPAATAAAPEAEHAVNGSEFVTGQPPSSSRAACPPPTAVPDRQFSASGIRNSSDLDRNQTRDIVEETSGFKEMCPGSKIVELPANVSTRNSASSLPETAAQTFEEMSLRPSSVIGGGNVQTVAGEPWERGPQMILSDGTTFRATFSPPPNGLSQILPGSGGSEQPSAMIANAWTSHRPGMTRTSRVALDTPMEGCGVHSNAPDRATKAGDQLHARFQAA